MTPEEQMYEAERDNKICETEIELAKMALGARKILSLGYSGHGIKNFQWQASKLIEHLETALYYAKKLSPDGLPNP